MDTGAAATQRVCVAALAVLSIILSGCSTVPGNVEDGRGFTRNFAWQYGGRSFNLAFDLHPDNYERFRERQRTREYDLFASDFHSKPFIRGDHQEACRLRNGVRAERRRNPLLHRFLRPEPAVHVGRLDDRVRRVPQIPVRDPLRQRRRLRGHFDTRRRDTPRAALRCRTAAVSGPHGRRLRVPSGDRTTPLPAPRETLLLPGDYRGRLGCRRGPAERAGRCRHHQADHRASGAAGGIRRQIPSDQRRHHRRGRDGAGDESGLPYGTRRHRVRSAAQTGHRPGVGPDSERPLRSGPGRDLHLRSRPACR